MRLVTGGGDEIGSDILNDWININYSYRVPGYCTTNSRSAEVVGEEEAAEAERRGRKKSNFLGAAMCRQFCGGISLCVCSLVGVRDGGRTESAAVVMEEIGKSLRRNCDLSPDMDLVYCQ